MIGTGNAFAVMVTALDAAWTTVDLTGVVVTRHAQVVPAGRIRVINASHAVPNAMGEAAVQLVLAAVSDLGPGYLGNALLSGGRSALMPLSTGDTSLADKQAVNGALLASGATIMEMNAVHKHRFQ